MIFKSPDGTPQTTPPPLVVYQGLGSFICRLDASWTFPTYLNWNLYSSESSDSGATYTAYSLVTTVTRLPYHSIVDLDPLRFYRFKYNMVSKTATSTFSPTTFAGQPKVIAYDLSSAQWLIEDAGVGSAPTPPAASVNEGFVWALLFS